MRARGANSLLHAKFEAVYGTAPDGNYTRLPFVSTTLGKEEPLLESELLGQGREPFDPDYEAGDNDGDLVVPVDARGFGYWLKLMLGAPVTSGGEDDDPFVHVFTSGAAVLPSMAIEVAQPDVPSFAMNKGVLGNTMRIAIGRRGRLNATLGLIAQDEDEAAVTGAGVPTDVDIVRFMQATGEIKRNGAALGNVVSADFSFGNSLEKAEVVRPDGLIAGADSGNVTMTGNLTVRFDSRTLLQDAESKAPVAMSFGWTRDGHSLLFSLPRVFLPRFKRSVEGPNGIQVQIPFQASGTDGNALTATLTNDVAAYA